MARPLDATIEIEQAVRRALKECGVVLNVLAQDADLAPLTLTAWTVGRRAPRRESARALADGLDRRARKLMQLADTLRSTAS